MSNTERVLGLVVAQAINAAINFLFLPYFVRVLSRADYGLYGQVILVGDTARVLFSMGAAAVLYVTLARSDDQPGDFKTLLFLSIGQGLVAALLMVASAGYFAASFNDPALKPLLQLYAAAQLFAIPYLCASAALIFLGQIRDSLVLTTSGLVFRVVIIVAAVNVWHSLTAVFAGLVLLSLLQLGQALYYLPKRFRAGGRFKPAVVKDRLYLGAQLGFTSLMGFAFSYTDKYMISSRLSVEDFAVYRNGTIELPVIGTLYTSIATIVLPMISKHYSDGNFDEIARLKRRLITVTAAVIYPMVFFLVVFSKTLVTTYFSPKYAAAAVVFAITSCGLLLRVNDYEDILVSSSRARLLILTNAAGFVLNVAINSVLISRFGYLGAAVSTLISYLLLMAGLFWVSARLIKKPWASMIDFKSLLVIASVSAALPVAFQFAAPAADRIAVALAYGAVSVCAAYFVFLKLGIIEYAELSPLVRKVPGLGHRLDRLLANQFSGGAPVSTSSQGTF